jgi:fucose 4-O-acetylase-like acetyltransferase
MMEVRSPGHFLVWMGNGFRMPLFIGLSGYLFNLDKAREVTTLALLGKYRDRFVLPWMFACCLYVPFHLTSLSFWTPLALVARPPFHLWFVPVLLCFFVLAQRLRMSRLSLTVAAVPISIGAMVIFGLEHGAAAHLAYLPDHRFFVYPLFFCFGMLIAERSMPTHWRVAVLLISLAGFLWWGQIYTHRSVAAEIVARMMMGLPLIAMLPAIFQSRFAMPVVNAVGIDSMFFYLWHPFVIAYFMMAGFGGALLLIASIGVLFVARNLVRGMTLVGLLTGAAPVPSEKQARCAREAMPST